MKNGILAFTLVFIVLLSCYVMIIPTIELLSQTDLIDSLALFDHGNSTPVMEFQVGDALAVVAEVEGGANVYFLAIEDQEGRVLSKSDKINGEIVEVDVPLYPPTFKAGHSYAVFFHAYAFNHPLPGVTISDMKVTGFTVVRTRTKLELGVNYSEIRHQLALEASLTNLESEPIANQTVDFHLQLNGNLSLRNRGWVPLGSSKTNADGLASLDLGCNVVSGYHYVKAELKGDEDFWGSSNRGDFVVEPYVPLVEIAGVNKRGDGVDVTVSVTRQGYPLPGKIVKVEPIGALDVEPTYGVTNEAGEAVVPLEATGDGGVIDARVTALEDSFTSNTCVDTSTSLSEVGSLSAFNEPEPPPRSPLGASGFIASSEDGVDVKIYPEKPYALLPAKVTATYVSNTPYNLTFGFYLDELGGESRLAAVSASVNGTSPPYMYTASLIWSPDRPGSHRIIVLAEEAYNLGVVYFNVSRCPSNLVVYYPQALYGNTSRITAAFSASSLSPYEPSNSSFFCEYSLAPQFAYNGLNYAVDKGVQALLKLYLNGTLMYNSTTDSNGLATIPLSLNLSDTYLTLNITAVVEPSLYNETVVKRVVTFTKVNVNDVTSGGSQSFKLSCTVNDEVYVGIENSIGAKARFDLPGDALWDVPMSSMVAKKIGQTEFCDRQMYVPTVPIRANYLHVLDSNADIYVVFSPGSGQPVYVDSQGYVRIPSNATLLAVYKGGNLFRCYADFLRLSVDMPVWNLPASVIVAKKLSSRVVGYGAVDLWTSGPSGANYIHVLGSTQGVYVIPPGDANGDGVVDRNDIENMTRNQLFQLLVEASKEWPCAPSEKRVKIFRMIVDVMVLWPFAGYGYPYLKNLDFNKDGKVNATDLKILVWHYGEPINFERVYVDSEGCASIPSGARYLSVLKGDQFFNGSAELLRVTSDQMSSTDNLGFAVVRWCPSEIGEYLVQVKLPSSFDTVVAYGSDLTQINADVNLVKYVNVVKRPVSLALSQPVTETFEASADAYVLDGENNNYGSEQHLNVQGVGPTGRSFLKFNLSAIPESADILYAELSLYCDSTAGTNTDIEACSVANDSWNETLIKWSNKPACNNISLDSILMAEGWRSWNVSGFVQGEVSRGDVLASFCLKLDDESIYCQSLFTSREYSDSYYHPRLRVSWLPVAGKLVVDALDEVTWKPASGLPIKFYVNGVLIGTVYTNSSGTAVQSWVPSSNIIYNVTVASPGNAIFEAANASFIVDLRTITSLRMWKGSIVIDEGGGVNVNAGETCTFKVKMSPPLSSVSIKVYVNDTYDGTLALNAGEATFNWQAATAGVYFFRIVFEGNSNYKSCEFRFAARSYLIPTSLSVKWKGDELIGYGGCINVDTFEDYRFSVYISPRLYYYQLKVYVNGSLYKTLSSPYQYAAPLSFDWWTDSAGAYSFRIAFEGNPNYKSCEFSFSAKAKLVIPVSLNFSVSPEEFEPGEELTLWARALNARTGSSISNLKLQFFNVSQDKTTLIANSTTNGNGEASTTWEYPWYDWLEDYKAHAVMVKVAHDQPVAVKHIVNRPVTLMVGTKTRLNLEVIPNYYRSYGYVICGTVFNEYGNDLGGEAVNVWVNGTKYSVITSYTETPSRFLLFLDLPPRNNQPTAHNITAVFEGYDIYNATAYDTLPDGTQYAACTTIQWYADKSISYYGYRPSSNSTWLTVEPQAVEAVTQTKTPEQMQQEAKDRGWLKPPEHQFFLGWPFYRLHLKLEIGSATIHLGFNPVLPGGEIVEYSNLDKAFPAINPEPGLTPEEMSKIIGKVVNKAVFGVLTTAVIAVAAANLRFLPSTVGAMIAYGAGSAILFYLGYQQYFSNETAAHTKAKAYFSSLYVSYLGAAVATVMPFKAAFIFKVFITTILSLVLANLIAPASLEANLMSLYYGAFTGLCVGLAALLIPEPSSAYFRPAFLVASLLFAIAAILTIFALE